MKNIQMFFVVIALLVTASFAQNVNVGARAALNFGTLSEEDVPWGLGFNAGVATKIGINPMLAVAPELDIDLRRQSDDDATWTTWAIEIPVLLRVNVIPQLFLEVGPSFALLLSSETEGSGVTVDYGSDGLDILNTFEIGLAVGAGYSVMPNLDVNVRFAYGFTSIVEDSFFGDDYKNIQLQLGATYWFL